jgi:hypothetical protein
MCHARVRRVQFTCISVLAGSTYFAFENLTTLLFLGSADAMRRAPEIVFALSVFTIRVFVHDVTPFGCHDALTGRSASERASSSKVLSFSPRAVVYQFSLSHLPAGQPLEQGVRLN